MAILRMNREHSLLRAQLAHTIIKSSIKHFNLMASDHMTKEHLLEGLYFKRIWHSKQGSIYDMRRILFWLCFKEDQEHVFDKLNPQVNKLYSEFYSRHFMDQ